MTNILQGRYFFPGSSRVIAARLEARGKDLAVVGAEGAIVAHAPKKKVGISSRLGNLVRRFDFPDGGSFRAEDNDEADAFLIAVRHARGSGLPHRLEKSIHLAIVGLVVAVAVIAGAIFYGIPYVAHRFALATPQSWADMLGTRTLEVLDEHFLEPSKLSRSDRLKANTAFEKVARTEKGKFRLLVRDGKKMGPNALALPDGTIVMTDALWKLVKDERELQGVFAHEISHITRRHSLQGAYQASFVPALIAFITGDSSTIANLATVLPTILIASSYSRGLEQQADDDAAETMRELGIRPSHLGDILTRMEEETCGKKKNCGASWIGSHPETAERVKRLAER